MGIKSLSIVCCTRDRPSDLSRLVDALVRARAEVSSLAVELLIVDDGLLPDRIVQSLAALVSEAHMRWQYFNKRGRSGLLRSRVEAVALATSDWILFIDDDVELELNYLSRFLRAIEMNPGLAGVGGVDVLVAPPPAWKVSGRILCGLEPLRLGRLSLAGFPAAIGRSARSQKPFGSQTLYGCNMGFRKSALQGLHVLPGFEGYSLYEDVFLSFVARHTGPLLIDPGLRIRHYHSPASRDGSFEVGRMSVLNHFELLRLYGAGPWRHVLAFTSFLCLIARSTMRNLLRGSAVDSGELDVARGRLSALKTLVTRRSARSLERSANRENE